MRGTDMDAIARAPRRDTRALTAAGGITTREEIDGLDAMGVDAVVGMALYTGKLKRLTPAPVSDSRASGPRSRPAAFSV